MLSPPPTHETRPFGGLVSAQVGENIGIVD